MRCGLPRHLSLAFGGVPSVKGAALITSLVFLIIITMIGITGMQTTTMQQRMAGNSRDREVAFQAAEAMLRSAEIRV